MFKSVGGETPQKVSKKHPIDSQVFSRLVHYHARQRGLNLKSKDLQNFFFRELADLYGWEGLYHVLQESYFYIALPQPNCTSTPPLPQPNINLD